MKARIWDIVGPLTGIIFRCALGPQLRNPRRSSQRLDGYITSMSAAEAANVLVDPRDQVEDGSITGLFGLAFSLGFLANFRSRLQRTEGEGGWLISMAYGGGLVTAAV